MPTEDFRGSVAIRPPGQDCLVIKDSLQEAIRYVTDSDQIAEIFKCDLEGQPTPERVEVDWIAEYRFKRAHDLTFDKFKEVYRRLADL